jgi:uncharacterized protein
MNLDLFDANLYLGRPTRGVHAPASTTSELLARLDQYGIGQALIWHDAQRDVSPVTGNALLSAAIDGSERLWGCWAILPPQTREVIKRGDDFFAQMKQQRIVALRAFPDYHRFMLNRVVFGRWLDEVSERRIPLMLSLEKGSTWPGIYQLLEQYPRLTCILCDIGIWGVDRYTWPLLENYGNVYLETSLVALEDGGMEATVAQYGAERLVFGSGFPERYPESAILQLLHADITDDDKRKIASGNLLRLIAEIGV